MGHLDKYSDDELFDILGSDVEEEIRSRGYEYGWHKKVTYSGNIYVLVNPAFPNLVKIGYADDVAKRVKSLNRNSGLPDPYHVYATYKVKKRLEDLKLHGLIDALDPDLRHAKNREFYEMSADDAYALLSAIAQINGDEELLEKNPFDDAFFEETVHELVSVTVDDSRIGVKSKIVRQPPFNFHKFGIENGSVIEFFDARTGEAIPSIKATVVGGRRILCDGVETSISAKAQEVIGSKHAPRGTEYWVYNGRWLVDIYCERYPKPEKKKRD